MHFMHCILFLLKGLAASMAQSGEVQAEKTTKKEMYFQKIAHDAGN